MIDMKWEWRGRTINIHSIVSSHVLFVLDNAHVLDVFFFPGPIIETAQGIQMQTLFTRYFGTGSTIWEQFDFELVPLYKKMTRILTIFESITTFYCVYISIQFTHTPRGNMYFF